MPLTLPYTIANGQAIDASPVMGNFNALANVAPAPSGTVAAASGANSDITSLTGLTTPLSTAQGGTGANLVTTPLPVALGGTGDAGTQWSTQTVTPTSGTGTLTSASAVWRFKVIGKTAFFNLVVTITTNGTGATNISVPFPAGWTSKSNSAYGGIEASVTAFGLTALASVGGAAFLIRKYDAAYLGGNGYNLVVSGVLELT